MNPLPPVAASGSRSRRARFAVEVRSAGDYGPRAEEWLARKRADSVAEAEPAVPGWRFAADELFA